MIRKGLIAAVTVAVLAGEVVAGDQTEYQQLDYNIRKIEVQAYSTGIVNAAAFELLCRETHPADYCAEMYKKAIKNSQERIDAYTKKVSGSLVNKNSSTPTKVIITDKWKDISLWRRKLQKNMTKDQVRSVFGEPDKIETYSSIGDNWYYGYPGGATISFSERGIVESWSEPHLK